MGEFDLASHIVTISGSFVIPAEAGESWFKNNFYAIILPMSVPMSPFFELDVPSWSFEQRGIETKRTNKKKKRKKRKNLTKI